MERECKYGIGRVSIRCCHGVDEAFVVGLYPQVREALTLFIVTEPSRRKTAKRSIVTRAGAKPFTMKHFAVTSGSYLMLQFQDTSVTFLAQAGVIVSRLRSCLFPVHSEGIMTANAQTVGVDERCLFFLLEPKQKVIPVTVTKPHYARPGDGRFIDHYMCHMGVGGFHR